MNKNGVKRSDKEWNNWKWKENRLKWNMRMQGGSKKIRINKNNTEEKKMEWN